MAAWTLHALTYLLDRSLATHAPTRRQRLRYRCQRLREELDAVLANAGTAPLSCFLLKGQNALMPSGLPSPVGAS